MAHKWLRPFRSKRFPSAGVRPRLRGRSRARKFWGLMVQVLEDRTLLSVSASVSSQVLDVTLSAAGDSATITFDGTDVDVSGTSYAGGSFSPSAFPSGLSVTGASLANQSVTFNDLGSVASPISLGASVTVSAVTTLTVSNSGFSTTGDVSFQIADDETGTTNSSGTTGQAIAQITISSSLIEGATVTIDAAGTMTASNDGNATSGPNQASVNVGSSATIAIDPTSPARVRRSSARATSRSRRRRPP